MSHITPSPQPIRFNTESEAYSQHAVLVRCLLHGTEDIVLRNEAPAALNRPWEWCPGCEDVLDKTAE